MAAGAPEEIIQRISITGQDDVIAALTDIGKIGEESIRRIVGALGPAGELLGGFAAAITGIGAALGTWAHHSAEATEAMGNLATQTGTTIENMSGLVGALTEAGAGTGELGGAFRRLAITVENEWAAIRKSVRESKDQMVGDQLAVRGAAQGVVQAELALRDAREANLRIRGITTPGDDPEVQAMRKRADAARAVQAAELNLAQARLKEREAKRKEEEDRKNAPETLAKAVEDIATGQKTLEEASKGANLEIGNIVKGILMASKAGEEGGLGIKQFGGGLGELATQGPKVLDVFYKLADVMHNSGSAATNTALQTKLLGRTLGEDMVAVLSRGSGALKEEIARLEKLGLVLTEADEKASKAFKVSRSTLSSELGTTATQIGNLFAPAFTQGMDNFRKTLEENHDQIISFARDVAETAKPAILDFFRILSGGEAKTDIGKGFQEAGTAIVQVASAINKAFSELASAINSVFGTHTNAAILEMAAAVGVLAVAVGGLPLALILAVAAALTKLVEASDKFVEQARKDQPMYESYAEALQGLFDPNIGKARKEDFEKSKEQKAEQDQADTFNDLAKTLPKTGAAGTGAGNQIHDAMNHAAAGARNLTGALKEAGAAMPKPGTEGARREAEVKALKEAGAGPQAEALAARGPTVVPGGLNLADYVSHPQKATPQSARPSDLPPQFRTVGDADKTGIKFRTVGDTSGTDIQFKTVADTMRQLGIGTPPKKAEPTPAAHEPAAPAAAPPPPTPTKMEPVPVKVVEGGKPPVSAESPVTRTFEGVPTYTGNRPIGQGTLTDLDKAARADLEAKGGPLAPWMGTASAYREPTDPNAKPLVLRAGKDMMGKGLDSALKEIGEASMDQLQKTLQVIRGLKPGESDVTPRGSLRDQGRLFPPGGRDYPHAPTRESNRYTETPVSFPGPRISQQQFIEAEIRRRDDLERAQERARAQSGAYAPIGPPTAVPPLPPERPPGYNLPAATGPTFGDEAFNKARADQLRGGQAPERPAISALSEFTSALAAAASFVKETFKPGGLAPDKLLGAPAAAPAAPVAPPAVPPEGAGAGAGAGAEVDTGKLQSALDSLSSAFQAATAPADSAAQAMQELTSGADQAAGALESVKPSGGGGGGFASGGPVRGPGTGTSDSILARVSHGEFVVRADGSNLMDAVSHFAGSFSLGGLIERMNLPRFASGGAVAKMAGAAAGAGGGGRPLVLDFSGAGGGKYHATVDHNTAESLTKFAIRKNMVSGGKKPNWFG